MSEKVNWTAEQSAAINARGRAVLVSAAAGSGKTAVLVERLTRLLTDRENPVQADKIVVVTFTKDAAAQMKNKLTEALTERLCREDITDEEAKLISSQLSLLPSANISTIHSYCFRLIRDNSGLAGVDPAFAVVSPEDEGHIIAKAAEAAFEGFIKKSPEKIKTLTDFFCGGEKSIEKLTDIILELREKYLTLPFPRDKMDGLVEYYKDNSVNFSPAKGVAAEYLNLAAERLENAAAAAKSLGGYLTDILNDLPERERENGKLIKNITGAVETVNDDHFLLKKLADNLAIERDEIFSGNKTDCSLFEESPEPVEAGMPKTDKSGNITGFARKSFPAIKFTENGRERDISTAAKEVRKLYYKAASDFYEFLNTGANAPTGTPLRFTPGQIKSDFKKHGEILELLFELLKEVMDRERDIKAERNVLGFCDAEQLACGLLCQNKNGEIVPLQTATDVADGIDLVLIDEFQDSTEIQELIFRMLSKGGSAKAPGSNFFAVGDVKQSIYRFRSAAPELFLKSLRESVPYEDKGDTPSHILLRRNFRSSRPVVDFVNKFFTAVMSQRRGGVDYGEADSLVCGRENGVGDNQREFPTEIIDITDNSAWEMHDRRARLSAEKGGNEPNDTNSPEKLTAEDFIEAEAEAVAARIKEIFSQTPGARLSDFCILSRYSSYFPVYARALEAAGLPSVSPAKTDLLERGETLAVINLLRAVDNPWKDVPLMAAMMSPLFMFTAEEMAGIRLLGDTGGGSLYGRIAAAANADSGEKDGADIRIKSRCADFLERFEELRRYALTHTSQEMILHIYEDMDYAAAAARSEGGREKVKNLDALVFAAGGAGSADKSTDGSVASFVRRIEAMKNGGGGMPIQLAAAGEAVSIMTIHGSKGLEFPYVFLCGNSKSVREPGGAACFYPSVGVGLEITEQAGGYSRERLKFATLPSCTVNALRKKSERDEDMMLLYVALTRARERLFITRLKETGEGKRSIAADILGRGAKFLGEPKRDCAVISESCLADIIASGLSCFEMSREISRYDPVKGTLRLICSDYPEAAVEEDDREKADGVSEIEKGEIDPEIYSGLKELLNARRDISLSLIPAKLTVSRLAKKPDTEEASYAPTPVFGEAPEEENIPFEMSDIPDFPEYDGYDPLPAEDEEEIIRPVSGRLTAADRGNAYHAFMQQADFGRLYNADNKEAAVKAEIEALANKGAVTEAQAECIDPSVIGKFLGSGLFSRMMKKGEFMRERKFLVRISDLGLDDEDLKVYTNTEGMLQGVADLIFKEEDGYVLCDYKTDRTASPGLLVNRYRRQLRLYAAAFSLILGGRIKEAFIYSFSLGQEIKIKL